MVNPCVTPLETIANPNNRSMARRAPHTRQVVQESAYGFFRDGACMEGVATSAQAVAGECLVSMI